jgi:rhodanese-related sulfurtransferase
VTRDASMTAQELEERITAGKAPAILDVRSRMEFNAGHVPGAVFIPFWLIQFLGPLLGRRLPAKRDETLVVYCGHGPRAWMAGASLRLRGFRDIQYLDGHWSEWAREGRPVER